MKFWIVPSEVFANTWFLFRNDGTEISIKTSRKGKVINSSLMLREKELKEFREKYLPTPIKNMRMKN